MDRGGRRRILFLAVRMRRPLARQASRTSLGALSRGVRPTIRPRRSILAMPGQAARQVSNSCPLASTFCRKAGLAMRSSMTLAPAQATGLPPKVEPWLPVPKWGFRASVVRQAPMGRPPPRPLARVMMSGWMPKCS